MYSVIQCLSNSKTLDACVTPGFLPSALRAALRAFKIAPGDFVAGMTCIRRSHFLCLLEHAFRYGISSPYHDKQQKNAVFIGPITGMHQLSGTAMTLTLLVHFFLAGFTPHALSICC